MPGYGESEIAQMESGKFVGSRQNGRYLIVVLNAAGGTKASQLLGEAVGGLDALAN
jgi:hypothetical protein